MIHVNIERYYGNHNITKSYVYIKDEEGNVLWQGEARENAYKDYGKEDKIPQSLAHCLPRGDFTLKVANDDSMPVCWKLSGEKSRMGYKLCCFDSKRQATAKKINLGKGEEIDEEFRRLCDIENSKEELMELIYNHYCDEVHMHIRNDKVNSAFT